MNFLYKLKMWIARFMEGRYGPDQFGIFTLIAGLVLSVLSGFIGLPVLGLLGTGLYVYTLFRLFSRNRSKWISENQKYLSLSSDTKTKARQFVLRQKNKKDYKYFRCPHCKVLLRMKRGTGEKEITCAKCQHQFRQKA